MDNQNLCMSCMRPLSETDTACPHCKYSVGRKNPAGYLAAGTVLQEHYMVGRALGSYGDACIYMGYDKLLKSTVYIREFFPADFCERTATDDVVPARGKEEIFATYRDAFYTNVRSLAKLKDQPALFPLYDIFTENETTYAIYDYCEGKSLSLYLKNNGGRLSWTELRPLLTQLFSTLSALHSVGVYHLAISPDTLLMANDGKLRLRSFAINEARKTGTAIKPRLAAGFAAPEQYVNNKVCDAASDVYGLAATIFTLLTGNTPPEAPRRVHGSQDLFLPAEVADELPESVSMALFNALIPDKDKRIQTVEDLRAELTAEPAVNALIDDAKEEEENALPPTQNKPNRYPLYIGISVFVVMAILAAILLCILFPGNTDTPPSDITSVTTTLPPKVTTTASDNESDFAVPDLVNSNYFTEKNATRTGNFVLEVDYMKFDSKHAKGTILSQSPAAGTSAAEGATIKVVISMGSEKQSLPNVKGWPQAYAKEYLEALGFRVEVLLLNVSEYDKDIVEDTEPAAFSILGMGETVTLRVSNVEKQEPSAETPDEGANGNTDSETE